MVQREGKQPRIQELCVHLQMAYRHWQRNKPDQSIAEVEAARSLINGELRNVQDAALLLDNLRVAQLAREKNQGELVVGALARAISHAEKMLRRTQ